MARLWSTGFELNTITDGVEVDTNSAPVSVVTTNPRSGTRHGRVNAGAGFWRSVPFTTNQTTVGYLGAAVCIHAAVNASTQLLRFSTSGNVSVGNITLTTSNTLVLLNAAGAQIGSASAALSLDTWYYVELKIDGNATAGPIEGRLNGSVFATGTNSSAGSWARALVGCITGTQTTNDIYFDDIKVNDSTGTVQNGYPGSGNLIYLRPAAAGDSNTFATQVGGTAGAANNYTRVSDTPPDDATSYNASNTLNQEDFFGVTASSIGSGSTVNAVLVGARFANITASDNLTTIKVEAKKTTGGTISQSAGITPTSLTWQSNTNALRAAPYPLVLYTDPDGAAWTSSTLNSMQIGYKLTATGSNPVAVSALWAIVDYTPGATPTNTGQFFAYFRS